MSMMGNIEKVGKTPKKKERTQKNLPLDGMTEIGLSAIGHENQSQFTY